MVENIPAQRTIPALLEYWSKIDPETPAYIFLGHNEDTVFSRGEIFAKAGKMASVLRHIGISKGDIIAVSMYDGQNCPDRLICELGIQMAGCVTVEASGCLKDGSDLLYIPNETNAKLIITSCPNFCNRYATTFSNIEDNSYNVSCPDAPSLKFALSITTRHGGRLDDILDSEVAPFMEDVCEADLAMIATTSGTTSYIKYVPYAQDRLVKVGEDVCMRMQMGEDTRFFNDRYMSWQPGYPVYFPVCGLTRVMRNHVANPPSLLDVFQLGTFSHTFLTSTDIHNLYLNTKIEGNTVYKGSTVIIGGQPVKKSLMKEALSFAKVVINFYGSTETGFISHICIKNYEEFDDYCVGFELPDVQIKILDDKEAHVKRGHIGKLFIKTPRQACGYLKVDGSLGRECFTEDGWFNMGDLGYRDAKGRLYVTGRGSDVILRGDDIIYPHLLEMMLADCPGVEDFAVVGVPDQILHQELCLVAKPKPSCSDPITVVKTFLEETVVPSNNEYCYIPKYILSYDSVLRNRNGKMDRKRLEKYAMEKLGI